MKPNKIYLTFKKFCELHRWPTFNSLRNIYRERVKRGYETAFLKEGKRILVDVDEFWECLRRKQKKE